MLKASLRRLDRQGGKRKDVEKAPTLQNFPSKGSFIVGHVPILVAKVIITLMIVKLIYSYIIIVNICVSIAILN